jgi:hypothetical protein
VGQNFQCVTMTLKELFLYFYLFLSSEGKWDENAFLLVWRLLHKWDMTKMLLHCKKSKDKIWKTIIWAYLSINISLLLLVDFPLLCTLVPLIWLWSFSLRGHDNVTHSTITTYCIKSDTVSILSSSNILWFNSTNILSITLKDMLKRTMHTRVDIHKTFYANS